MNGSQRIFLINLVTNFSKPKIPFFNDHAFRMTKYSKWFSIFFSLTTINKTVTTQFFLFHYFRLFGILFVSRAAPVTVAPASLAGDPSLSKPNTSLCLFSYFVNFFNFSALMRNRRRETLSRAQWPKALAKLTWRSPNPTCLPHFVPCLRVVAPPCLPFTLHQYSTQNFKSLSYQLLPSKLPRLPLCLWLLEWAPWRWHVFWRGSILLASSSYINHTWLAIVTSHNNSSSVLLQESVFHH